MRDDYTALIKNKTWTLVSKPPDTNIVRCMWLADGTLSRYKARLVANGSTQLEGVDVDESFSSVVKPGTIRTGTDTAYLLLYVDDIVLIVSSESFYSDASGCFLSQKKYALEILGKAHMANCNPCRTPIDTESKLGSDGDLVSDPTLLSGVLAGSHTVLLQFIACTFIMRFIMVLFFICMILESLIFLLLKGILRVCSRVTLELRHCVIFPPLHKPGILVAYSDADWVGCPTTRRSTSCYCVFLGNNLLSWSSKRQPTLSHSSAEAEYRGVANDVAETCWLRNLLRELHTPLSSATLVYCDNVSAVYLSCNPVQHQRTKHIEIDIHFVRDLVAAGQVRVLHVPSRYQFADIFTKGFRQLYLKNFAPV
ncbi:ribonuclease H-like domain-containing protein [Tanacetum coccineum]